jgi:hypothetical protein
MAASKSIYVYTRGSLKFSKVHYHWIIYPMATRKQMAFSRVRLQCEKRMRVVERLFSDVSWPAFFSQRAFLVFNDYNFWSHWIRVLRCTCSVALYSRTFTNSYRVVYFIPLVRNRAAEFVIERFARTMVVFLFASLWSTFADNPTRVLIQGANFLRFGNPTK